MRASEACDMGPPVALGNIVRVGEYLLLEAIVPLHGNFDADAVFPHRRDSAPFRSAASCCGSGIRRTPCRPPFVKKALFLADALVDSTRWRYPRIEERELAQPLRQDVVVKLDVAEGLRRGPEVALRSMQIRFSHRRQRCHRVSPAIGLLERLPIAVHGQAKFVRQARSRPTRRRRADPPDTL